jgi:glycosyltransferase involved in cell wall biosynthesis
MSSSRGSRDIDASRDREPTKTCFVFGFIGVPVLRKNLHKLFDACEQLRDEIPSLRLAVHVSKFYEWLDRENWD